MKSGLDGSVFKSIYASGKPSILKTIQAMCHARESGEMVWLAGCTAKAEGQYKPS
jgi:hypothetical protein